MHAVLNETTLTSDCYNRRGETASAWLWLCLGFLAAILCWLPLAGAFFSTDDFLLLEGSLRVWQESNTLLEWLRTVFLQVGLVDYNYRPLSTHLYYLVHQKIFGLDPLPYHLSVLLCHALSSVAVSGIVRSFGLTGLAAGFAGLFYFTRDALFGSIAWIAGIQDVLLTFLATAGAWSLVRFVHKGGRRWQVVSLLFFISAFFAKEMALPLPVMVTVLAWAAAEGNWRQRARLVGLATWPHWLAWGAFYLFRVTAIALNTQQYPLGLSQLFWLRPGIYAFWTLFSSFSFSWAEENRGLFFCFLALVGYGVLVWGTVRVFTGQVPETRTRLVWAGILWWLAGVLFVSLQRERFASNYLALPAIGGALAVGAGFELFLARFSLGRQKMLATLTLSLLSIGVCAGVNRLKAEERIPSGGVYAPLSSEAYREIYRRIQTIRPGLLGCQRVIWLDYDDTARVTGNPDGAGYRHASTIASMVRVMFNRPDVQVVFTLPRAELPPVQDNDPENLVAEEEILPRAGGVSDLLLFHDPRTNQLLEMSPAGQGR